jgi:hypothetical protein
MWEPEWNDAGSAACGDSRRAGWPQRARVLARFPAAGGVAPEHLHVLTQVAKSAWRNSPAQALRRTAALQLPQIAGVQTALRTILIDRRAPSLRHRLGI